MKKALFYVVLYSFIFSISAQNYVPFIKDSLWGLATWKGDVVFAPQWKQAETKRIRSMHEYDLFTFKNEDRSLDVVHAPSNTIISGLYDVMRADSSGIVCRKGENYGFIKNNGKISIPFRFSYVQKNKYAAVYVLQSNGRNFALYKEGDPIPEEFPYSNLRSVYFSGTNETGFIAQKNNKWGFLDTKKQIIIPFDYEILMALSQYGSNKVLFFKAKKLDEKGKAKWSLLNAKGETLIAENHSDLKAYSRAVVAGHGEAKNSGWQLLSPNGNPLSQDSLRRTKWIQKSGANDLNLIEVWTKKGKQLYFNEFGEIVESETAKVAVKANRTSAEQMRMDSLGSIFSVNEKKGFVSHKGDTLLQPRYDLVRMIGSCLVTLDNTKESHLRQELHFIDGKSTGIKGRTAMLQYLEPYYYKFPVIQFTTLLPSYLKNTEKAVPYRAYYRNPDGSKLIDGEFETFIPELIKMDRTGESKMIVKVKQNEGWGYYSKSGEEIIPAQYENAKPLIEAYLFLVKRDGEEFVINAEGKVY